MSFSVFLWKKLFTLWTRFITNLLIRLLSFATLFSLCWGNNGMKDRQFLTCNFQHERDCGRSD